MVAIFIFSGRKNISKIFCLTFYCIYKSKNLGSEPEPKYWGLGEKLCRNNFGLCNTSF